MDGALIVQPINHKFDHSLVTRSVEITYLEKCLVFILIPCVRNQHFTKLHTTRILGSQEWGIMQGVDMREVYRGYNSYRIYHPK